MKWRGNWGHNGPESCRSGREEIKTHLITDVSELHDIYYPATQRKICADDHHAPIQDEFRTALDSFGYNTATPFQVEAGHALTHVLSQQRRYALQHQLRFQVWEAGHLHRAHRRTPGQLRPGAGETAPTRPGPTTADGSRHKDD
ncbi:hypothetical protein [Nocardiopsis dassonvillei]|uniref:hypothetical protein n=1 Tax=Nocardiopsis dassonvillei TaxID=2014 RepID=UPI003F54C364